ncbi:MAG: hypothetical protein PHG99_07735, partial [Erysipelotrichaceae bacterium]|nr:hypothetical protein [Erysipelotrichaceae bacterium]
LAITGGFVPFNDTVTLLSYKHLRPLNYQIDVVALAAKADESIISELQNDPAFKKFNVEYVSEYDKTVASLDNKNVFKAVYNIYRYIKSCVKKAADNDYKIVYSSSLPAFTMLAAYLIKRKNKNIFWIASFSDPLINSPYKYDQQRIKEYDLITRIGFHVYIFIYMNNWYERLAIKKADRIIYVSEEQRDFMIANHQDQEALLARSRVVGFNYIKDWQMYRRLLDPSQQVKHKPLIAAHFGRIYGLRKIDNFLLALRRLKDEIVDIEEQIIFYQYGEIMPRYQKMIKELELDDLFICHDRISYDEVANKMIESDILLLFDTLLDDDSLQPFLPSKILEYIILRKEILAICQVNSPTYRILSSLNHKQTENDLNRIYERIKELMVDLKTYDYDISNYENDNVTKII